MQHDAQLDYYGARLATASSDRLIKVYDLHSQTGAAAAGGAITQDTACDPVWSADIAAYVPHAQGARTQGARVCERVCAYPLPPAPTPNHPRSNARGTTCRHEGPVWQVAWSHPRFGPLLASCGYDRRVAIHREMTPGAWARIFTFEGHASSGASAPRCTAHHHAPPPATGAAPVLCPRVCSELHRVGAARAGAAPRRRLQRWKSQHPQPQGYVPARTLRACSCAPDRSPRACVHVCACARVRVCACGRVRARAALGRRADDDSWAVATIPDCKSGVLAVSWAPALHIGSRGDAAPSSAAAPAAPSVRRIATAGADNQVRVYRSAEGGEWALEHELHGHSAWVRDVAWAPTSGMTDNLLASCSDDSSVAVWRQARAGEAWTHTKLPAFPAPVWKLSWSVTGNLLAVSCADNSVTLWKQALGGTFHQVSTVQDAAAAAT
ncbi:hypothetical protein EON68_00760 [archaeon]|nr:MAG: hypothetical protein EON68_00760 [archaeon]